LTVDEPFELGVAWCPLAERRRGHDAVDVQRVARVLAVCDGVGDERLLVLDALALQVPIGPTVSCERDGRWHGR
jgi:hypothetical protein